MIRYLGASSTCKNQCAQARFADRQQDAVFSGFKAWLRVAKQDIKHPTSAVMGWQIVKRLKSFAKVLRLPSLNLT